MIESTEQNITNRASLEGISCSFDKPRLRRFLEILQERLSAAAEFEVSKFEKANQSDDEHEANKQLLRDGFIVRPTITGQNGQELYGNITEVFDSPNFPEEIRSVYVNSEIWLRSRYNYVPHNTIELFLDFSRPAIFDFSFLPSQKTPNETNIKVRGIDSTWVNGIFHEADAFIKENSSAAPWLHKHTVYDILVWLFGLPIGFWVCFKASAMLPSAEGGIQFLVAAVYVYLFMATLVGIRALFHYARWVFPIAEFIHPRSKLLVHRAILGALVLALFGSVIYDVAKAGFLG